MVPFFFFSLFFGTEEPFYMSKNYQLQESHFYKAKASCVIVLQLFLVESFQV